MNTNIKNRENIIDEYVAQKPSAKTSSKIVESISAKYGLKIASIRQILVSEGVYIAKENIKNSPESRDISDVTAYMLNYYPDSIYSPPIIKIAAKEFGYTQEAMRELLFQEGLMELSPYQKEENARMTAEKSFKRKKRYALWIAITSIFALFLYTLNTNQSSDNSVEIGNSSDSGKSDFKNKYPDMTDTQEDRYDNMTSEGQDFVDEKMRKYDEFCARSTEC